MSARVERLRALLAEQTCHVMPCCFDGLSARLIERAGFSLSFMSGFGVSAARLGAPDTGLISYGEMVDTGRAICDATRLPVIGDGDTGYGNALNVQRTVRGYAQAGFAGILIEDQVAPKRCGHTRGKQVVERAEAFDRIRAAIDARNEGADILILARTDARQTHGLSEAIERAQGFSELGADILFVEAPQTEEELALIPRHVPGVHLANMLEGGRTPLLPAARLHELGFRLAAYPLTLLSTAIRAMKSALSRLHAGEHPADALLDFAQLRADVGFEEYYAAEARYASLARKE